MFFEIENNLKNIDRCVLSQILKNNVGIFTQDELIDILKSKLRNINPIDLAYITPLPKHNGVQKNTYKFSNNIDKNQQDICRELLEDRDKVLAELKVNQSDNASLDFDSIGMMNKMGEINWVRSMRYR